MFRLWLHPEAWFGASGCCTGCPKGSGSSDRADGVRGCAGQRPIARKTSWRASSAWVPRRAANDAQTFTGQFNCTRSAFLTSSGAFCAAHPAQAGLAGPSGSLLPLGQSQHRPPVVLRPPRAARGQRAQAAAGRELPPRRAVAPPPKATMDSPDSPGRGLIHSLNAVVSWLHSEGFYAAGGCCPSCHALSFPPSAASTVPHSCVQPAAVAPSCHLCDAQHAIAPTQRRRCCERLRTGTPPQMPSALGARASPAAPRALQAVWVLPAATS